MTQKQNYISTICNFGSLQWCSWKSVCTVVTYLKFQRRESGVCAKPTDSWHSDLINLLIKLSPSETLIYLKYHCKIYMEFKGLISDILEITYDIL